MSVHLVTQTPIISIDGDLFTITLGSGTATQTYALTVARASQLSRLLSRDVAQFFDTLKRPTPINAEAGKRRKKARG